jgi:hypothetical protein
MEQAPWQTKTARRGSYFAKLLFVKGSKKTTLLLSFMVLLLLSEQKKGG